MIAQILMRWRWIAAGAVLLLVLYAGLQGHAARTARLQTEAALAAKAGAEHATAVVDRYHQDARAIEQTVQGEADAVHQTPGADAALDPRRRADLCAALGRLRHVEQPCDDPGEPAGAVRAGGGGAAADPG